MCVNLAEVIDKCLGKVSVTAKCIAGALKLWKQIDSFMKITTVDKNEQANYKNKIKQFKKDVVAFYECGKTTFLSLTNKKFNETYYMHALCFYLSDMVDITWKRHKCGIGVYNMQAIEHRNKESKFFLVNCCNKKHNIVNYNIRRLQDKFLPYNPFI